MSDIDFKSILIVEDEAHTRLSVGIILKRAGYKVYSVGDGVQALELLERKISEEESCDLILSDIQMPEMSGLELIRAMKQKNITIPVIVFTGFGDKATVIELLREGVEEYLDKPFNEKDLLNRVSSVLRKEEEKKQQKNKQYEQMSSLERKVEAYKVNMNLVSSSVESAMQSYHEIIGTPVSSRKVNIAVRSLSRNSLGGDFAASRDTDSGIDLIVADVTGHDMGASYYTILIKAFFDENCRIGGSGKELFCVLNSAMLERGLSERMATAMFLRINLQEMWAELVSAAHPYLIRINPETPDIVLRPISRNSGFVLGMLRNAEFEVRRFSVSSGDRIFIYTDGIPDSKRIIAESGAKEKLGDEGVRNLLKKSCSASLEEGMDIFWNSLMNYCRFKSDDDMLLLGLEIPGKL